MSKRSRTLFEMVTAPASSMTTGNASKIGSSKRKYNKTGKFKGQSFAKKVKQVLQNAAEKKEVLTSINNTANATATFVTLVSGVAQGTTNVTRIGNEVTHAYIEVSLGIYNVVNTTATVANISGDFGFWALVLDRQPNGAAPIFTDIFDNSAGTAVEGTDFRITTTNQDRFKILSREEWSVGCCGTDDPTTGFDATGAAPYHVKEFVDLSKLGFSNPLDQKANFGGTGATIASINSGAIFFVWASSYSTATVLTTLGGQVKYRYIDV